LRTVVLGKSVARMRAPVRLPGETVLPGAFHLNTHAGRECLALALARKHFDTGMIHINSFGAADPNMPFGGVKDFGYGREHGGFGLKEFVSAKSIFLP